MKIISFILCSAFIVLIHTQETDVTDGQSVGTLGFTEPMTNGVTDEPAVVTEAISEVTEEADVESETEEVSVESEEASVESEEASVESEEASVSEEAHSASKEAANASEEASDAAELAPINALPPSGYQHFVDTLSSLDDAAENMTVFEFDIAVELEQAAANMSANATATDELAPERQLLFDGGLQAVKADALRSLEQLRTRLQSILEAENELDTLVGARQVIYAARDWAQHDVLRAAQDVLWRKQERWAFNVGEGQFNQAQSLADAGHEVLIDLQAAFWSKSIDLDTLKQLARDVSEHVLNDVTAIFY